MSGLIKWGIGFTLIFILSACVPLQPPQQPTIVMAETSISQETSTPMPSSTATIDIPEQLSTQDVPTPVQAEPTVTMTTGPSPTPAPTYKPPKYWSEWPLIPVTHVKAREIYQKGQMLGLDPHAFSVIGDCQSEPPVFLGTYDSDSYALPENEEYLQETIEHFKGSFNRNNVTVKDGMSVASVLSPLWAEPDLCQPNENPLACEVRIHKPVIVFINLGTNWRGGDDVSHEKYLRQIVGYLVEQGIVPILSSKGDNQEGDHRINRSTAAVAYDYDLPFWNFWLSIRDLPGKGIDGSREGGYLTTEAWSRRSYTGLLALDAVWRALSQ